MYTSTSVFQNSFLCVFLMFFLIIPFNLSLAIEVKSFKEGFNKPTGLAINSDDHKLYVNSGLNGNLWSIKINSDGTSGDVELITSGFSPKLDMALDANMNIYGIEHGKQYIYQADSKGQVTSSKISDEGSSAIAIEPPGLNGNKLFYGLKDTNYSGGGYLRYIYLSSYEASGYSHYDGFLNTCNTFRFMKWRAGQNEIIATADSEAVIINPTNGSCNSLISGMVSPHGIAQDNAGNIYVADTGTGTIKQATVMGKTNTIITGLYTPIGLAFDKVTNLLFVSESTSGKISSINMNSTDTCPKTVTFARNPVTEEWGAFPTPCDVPLRWTKSYSNPSWYQSSGGSTGTSESITLNEDLSFQIQNMNYSPTLGPGFNLETNFKFFGKQNGKLLWELYNYKIK